MLKSHPEIRFVWPLATVSLLLLGLGMFGAWHVHKLQRRASAILAVNVASIRAGEELEIVVRETRYHLNQFLLTQDSSFLQKVPELQEQARRWLAEAKRFATTDQEQQLIAQIDAGYEEFEREFDTLEPPPPGDAAAETVKHLARVVLPKQILAHARQYLDANEQDLARSSDENDRLASRLAAGLLLLGVCGAAAGGVAGYTMARAVRRSIVELNVPIRDVHGKLNEVVGPFPVPTNAGIDGLDAVLRTISERVAMVVEELQQTQQDALRSEQLAAVGQLAAGLAHELRNPLMAMKLLVQSACEQGEEASLAGRDLAVIEEEIGRLEHLVQMFLDFARPPRLEKREIDLRTTIERVVHLLEPRAAARLLQLAFARPDRPVVVEADETQVRQVLLNLVLNAMDAVAGGGRIDVGLELQDEPDVGRWAVVRVADDGCGLPAELGNRIFDPFVSTKETGIGLGLSICRRIVETHSGGIAAAPAPGGGTVFTVRLPVDVPSANSTAKAHREPAAEDDSTELQSTKGNGCQRSSLSTMRPTSSIR